MCPLSDCLVFCKRKSARKGPQPHVPLRCGAAVGIGVGSIGGLWCEAAQGASRRAADTERENAGDEAAAAATRYTRRPVVGGAPAKIEETTAPQETSTEETSTSTEE